MFSGAADLGKLLKTPEELVVSEVFHKALVEVNEEGTKAAASSGKRHC